MQVSKIIIFLSALFVFKPVWAEDTPSRNETICDPALMFFIQQVKGDYPLDSVMSEEIKKLGFQFKLLPDQGEGEDYGTGFFISETGLFLTAYHLIKNAETISLQKSDGSVLKATVLVDDPTHDIAILAPVEKTKVDAWLPLGSSEKEAIGQKVKILSHPFPNMDKDPKLSVGKIYSGDLEGDAAYFQMTAPVYIGCSGSPILNQKNEVVGIVNGDILGTDLLRETGALPANRSLGVKAEELKALSDVCNSEGRTSPRRKPVALSKATDATALVKVNNKNVANNISAPDNGMLVLIGFSRVSQFKLIDYTLIELKKNSCDRISGEIKYAGTIAGSPRSPVPEVVRVAIDEILKKLILNNTCRDVAS